MERTFDQILNQYTGLRPSVIGELANLDNDQLILLIRALSECLVMNCAPEFSSSIDSIREHEAEIQASLEM